tara:strand:- start:510 stop:1109 length:600 start_codon:yes stop_codon:yes gene_type:complete
MCMGGSRGDGGAAERRRAEEERQARIRAGDAKITDQFKGFDDAFYDNRRNAYLDFAKPQVTDQYEDAFKQLTLALADSNLLNSSAAARRRGDLLKKKGEYERQIGSKANEYANTARSQVEAAKSDLRSQNMNIANPTLVAANAAQRARSLNEVPVFDPLVNLFAGAAEGLSTQADLERRGKNRYDSGLFDFKGSGTVKS